MADQHEIDSTIDSLHAAGATDDEVTSLIKEKYGKPFDVKAQNATMRANMAKQPEGTGVEAHPFLEGAVNSDYVQRGPADMGRGLRAIAHGDVAKGTHTLATGAGVAALPFAPAAVAAGLAAAPAATLGGLAFGTAGVPAGRAATKLVTDNPDYINVGGDVGGAVGAGLGGLVGNAAGAPALRFVGEQMIKPEGYKQMIGRGLVRLAEKPAPTAAELGVVPTADAAASLPTASSESGAHRTPISISPEELAAKLRARLGLGAPVAGDNADVAVPYAPMNGRGPAPQGTGMERTIDQPLYKQQAALENGEILTGRKAVEPVAHPTRPVSPTSKATGVESLTKAPAFKEPTPVAKFGFEWPEVGDQYELLQDIPGHKKGSHVSAETLQQAGVPVPAKPTGHTEPSLEVVDSAGGPNASGESAASREALSRQSAMQARGEEFVVKRGNTMRKLVGPDAVDYTPQAGETFGVRDKAGNFRPLSDGETKQALTASRGKGAMPIAMRRALYNAMMKRSGQ